MINFEVFWRFRCHLKAAFTYNFDKILAGETSFVTFPQRMDTDRLSFVSSLATDETPGWKIGLDGLSVNKRWKKSSTCKLWNCDLEKLIVKLNSLTFHDSGRLHYTINLPIESCSRRFNEIMKMILRILPMPLDNNKGKRILTFLDKFRQTNFWWWITDSYSVLEMSYFTRIKFSSKSW